MLSLSSRTRRSIAAACATGVLAGLATLGASGAAQAASGDLKVVYNAVGTSHLAKTNSDIPLGPTKLRVKLNPTDGSFTGHLPLPSKQSSFKALGLLPVSATVTFKEAAPVTGSLVVDGLNQSVTSTATYYIQLTNVTVGGLPAFVGNSCQTAAPVVIPANTPAGGSFDITAGGTLTGTYTIGNFANCGLTTGILNLLVPGSGNTETITLSNGRIAG